MQQEARNTETHGRSWSDSNLRHKAVLFVSAGSLEPTKEEDEQIKSDSDPEEPTPDEAEGQAGESDSLFFLDSTKQEIDTGLPDPVIQTKQSDSDDSSEDEVVFTGRRKTAKPVIVETHQTEIEKFVHNTPSPLQTAQGPVPVPREPSPPVVQVEHTHTESLPESPTWPPKQQIDPIADYIANIDKDYYEELTGMKLDSDDDIGVEKAATQLDLSTASPAGSKRRSSRSLDAGQNAPSDNITTPVDGGILNYLRRLRKLLTFTSSTGLAQMQIDTEHDSISASSEDDEDDEDLVFSDSDDDAIEDFILLEDLAKGYSKSGKKGTRSGKPAFPSASAFADALEADPYFGFDIMDFERPSLRNKPKGKHAIPELELSDSEFEIELQQAWQNDRTKKKLRKKEREELRAQGMLGRKAGNPDLKVKYSKEMNMEEFMTELRSFLLSSKNRYDSNYAKALSFH